WPKAGDDRVTAMPARISSTLRMRVPARSDMTTDWRQDGKVPARREKGIIRGSSKHFERCGFFWRWKNLVEIRELFGRKTDAERGGVFLHVFSPACLGYGDDIVPREQPRKSRL